MPESQISLEGGAYEVIRARLQRHEALLRQRLDELNAERKAVFGAIEPCLLGTERITTEHNCVPRDMIAIGGGNFLFGYNIQFGLKQTTDIGDVFAAYAYDPTGHTFSPLPVASILTDKQFADDFGYLYKYYRETAFAKFMVIGPHLYMAMRIGKEVTDIKTFKWRMPGNGSLEYLGTRFDHEYKFPPQQEFEWIRAHRDMHRSGPYPHISIADRLFVETVGGDLTLKIEDNTTTGEGIYHEDITDRDQSLDDAEIFYAIIGPLILLRILPYREELYRHLVYNEKTKTVHRLDAIGDSCVLLPDDQGIVFANGYLLQTGEVKIFDHGRQDMRFERRILSANGEDTLFAFYNRRSGDYVLLSYNLIAQTVDTPILCNGCSLFPNGELIYFRTEDEAQKHHSLQIWQTPVISQESLAAAAEGKKDSYLYKIGNTDLVRGMAECRAVLILLGKDDTYGGLYLDLVKETNNILDIYFWLARPEARNLAEPLREINAAARAAIDEFDKVRQMRLATAARSEEVSKSAQALLRNVASSAPDDILEFVQHLAEMRRLRGEVIGLRDLRYVDVSSVDELETKIAAASETTSQKTVEFLLKEQALDPYHNAVESQRLAIAKVDRVAEADIIGEALTKSGAELEMLIDIVGNLKISDATQTTAIIDGISGIYAALNGVRGELRNKRRELARTEGVAQFGAQIKLLSQAVVNYLDLCDTPEKCEEYVSKLMVQVEELEGRFSEFDEYVDELTAKREEIYNAFEGRKTSLQEQRSRRANALVRSGDRILNGIRSRVATFKEITDISGYFAGDLMIEKIRELIDELKVLGDPVSADSLQTRLKTLREDTVRQLKDRKDLYVDGENVIRFGRHAFNVGSLQLELAVVPRDGRLCFHLAGTMYFEVIDEPALLASKAVWEQEIVSENTQVYRSEWLAFSMLKETQALPETITTAGLKEAAEAFMRPRFTEGYTKGVHDEDAVKLLEALVPIHRQLGLLRHGPQTRALAMIFWECQRGTEKGSLLDAIAAAHRQMRGTFQGFDGSHPLQARLAANIAGFAQEQADGALATLPNIAALAGDAACYLYEELSTSGGFVTSGEAAGILSGFRRELTARRADAALESALAPFGNDPARRYEVLLDWLSGHHHSRAQEDDGGWMRTPAIAWLAEAAAQLLRGGEHRATTAIPTTIHLTGLRGDHPVIGDGGSYATDYHAFASRLGEFERLTVPCFTSFQALKHKLTEKRREQMRLDEFKPHVMSSFVRNRLINEVYLPLIGDNLAKQLGTAGPNTRTDRSGLLLLVSPPGYGKTTVMEYVANRLGIIFMKINGPALGHHVTSLDPAEAPNLAAREEIEKLNLALEMGDNVMLYLDDIQHTNPEFLQKFISLCDAQRKIEGVFKGRARTYDLRGRKVAVVMAGNPYTESGGRFQIPDMLANRADTYNLGDILGGHEDAFKASYIENALTSNAALSQLSSRSQKDVHAVMHMAKTGEPGDFEGNYTPAEIDEMVKVMRHLFSVRDTILRVNLEYIASAAQDDSYRTEPSFRLQGSYRNMNRIAERVVPLMTHEEVRALVVDHYQNEAQTLTQAAEANLLKFRELEGILTDTEAQRWAQIKKDFARRKLLGGAGDDDPVARVVAQLVGFQDGLAAIQEGIANAGRDYAKPQTLGEATVTQLREIIAGLRAVPVEVDINVQAVSSDPGSDGGIETMEKRSRAPLAITPEVRQLDGEA